MGDRQDYVALDWVAGEIRETLTQASQALQAYISNRDDTTKLRFCLTHIHQVHGTLKMVEFFGAALLAEEMECLAQALAQGIIHDSHVEDALSVLNNAIVQLPAYLERVKESRHSLPATLLPVLNDLRAIRGESLLSETVLFAPNMSASVVSGGAKELLVEGNKLKEVVHKLRQMYQIALLGLIREQEIRKNINYLAKVCARLTKLTAGRASLSLWKVCIALLEGLLNKTIESSVAVKILLRQIDREIKNILDLGEAALEQAPPENLLKNLLYYIATSKGNSRFIKEIKNEYNLQTSLLGDSDFDQELATPDSLAMQSVVEALAQELGDIKSALSAAGTKTKALTDVLPLFRRVSDTMAILGMGSTLKPIQESHSQLAKLLATQDVISSNDVNEIIQQVCSVIIELNPEQIIDPVANNELFNDSEEAQEQLDGAFDSVIRECRAGLEQTKEAIIEFVATQWNHNCLSDVPNILLQIQGSLAIVPLEQASLIIQSCEQYVSNVLLQERIIPEWQMLDTLADAITSIDYYLERVADDTDASNDSILEVAAESAAELGFPIKFIAQKDDSSNDDLVNNYADSTGPTETASTANIETSTLQKDTEGAPALAEVIPFQLPQSNTADRPDQATPAPENIDDDDYDPEIVEIFIEEAGEVIETINESLPQWAANVDDEEARATVRRAFHTLKGSGRMVKAIDVAELAWSIESMLNRVIDGLFTMDQVRFDIVTQAKNYVPGLVAAFENRQSVELGPIEALIQRADALTKEQNPPDTQPSVDLEQTLESPPKETQAVDEKSTVDEAVPADGYEFDAELLEIFASETAVHLKILDDFIGHCKELSGPAELSDDLQRALHTLKGSANMAGVAPVAMLITPVEHVVKELRASQLKVDEPLVGLLEQASKFIRLGIEQMNTTPMQSLPGVESFIDQLMTLYKERIAQATDENSQESIVPEAQNQLLTESLDRITEINDKLAFWRSKGLGPHEFTIIENSINRLIDNAESVNMIALAEFGQAMQALFRCAANYNEGNVAEDFFELAANGCDALIDMLDQIAGHQNPQYDLGLLTRIQDYEFDSSDKPIILADEIKTVTDIPVITEHDLIGHAEGRETTDEDSAELIEPQDESLPESNIVEMYSEDIPTAIVDEQIKVTAIPVEHTESPANIASDNKKDSGADIITEVMSNLVDAVNEAPNAPAGTSKPFLASADDDSDEDIDAEILEIFLEEADDLIEAIDETIDKWGNDRKGSGYLDDLQRILHTLKGGARLSKLTELGNLSHNFETFLIGAEAENTIIDDAFLSEVQRFQDQLITQLVAIKAGEAPPEVASTEETKNDITSVPAIDDNKGKDSSSVAVVKYQTRSNRKAQSDVVPFVASKSGAAAVAPTPTMAPAASPNMGEVAAKKGPQEVVKVSAQLLEDLVNLAGETSISRGQAEEQISELVFSLEEMQITVDRLQEQVRRLDMETEQQILYRQEQVESEGLDGFDPLEMDRYSALQQLSRSLMESSSDLIDIKSTLHEKSRDMETLLIQQSRINTELQEGLMRSRMVPFSRMVPRLRRIVRQVSAELDKKVDFKLYNIEGELDRTVLEKMVAPLEHMLRNAIDHGLELPAERERANKPKKGTVSLSLNREGGEIVITMSDDGAGINLNAVKNKAIERGLMEPDANLSDHEISQFILQSGFSTATQVTQLSGRGVGMDVVHSEIKQLGGAIDIESILGQGTQFIVRLPFTVSVNRALMVSVDGDIYAIPLNTIEGIVRVSPFELEAYYQPDAPMFEYAGQPYLLRYMGALLRRGEKPLLDGQSMPLPVILVRGAEHSVAIQVDHLMGSREIVVKPLGPQFSLVQGLTGATVLGDGSVVVILDLLAMIRADASHLHRDFIHAQASDEAEERAVMVMVVDDSVTVRKVTSRFLERQGFDVLLAKDGVDAMTQLQELERIPDVMLLDIEMPRMDGFEVASRVRHSSRLKELPIIMITSRTGEKHRERALALGVNYYMGKPYQEVELLDTINNLAGTTVEQ